MDNFEERMEAILQSPVGSYWIPVGKCEEELTMDERERKEERKQQESKEQQQDFFIQENKDSIASIVGELFGRNGSGGFVGEIRKTTVALQDGQKEILEKVTDLVSEMKTHKVEAELKFQAHATQISDIRKDLGCTNDAVNDAAKRISSIDGKSGSDAKAVLVWLLKLVGYIIISGGFIAIGAGLRAMFGG